MKNTHFTIHSDGGARGNPGPAAYGFVVTDDNKNLVHKDSGYIGETTNNVAEYTGVVKALEWILKHTTPTSLSVILDSELVARQLSGIYKIKNENLKKYYLSIKELERDIHCPITFSSVPRNQNKEADALVNAALDNHLLT
ncbi:MAG TPA: ribonuclease HI family protein [Candidatus Levybacteria bacterium]|nr:ribonuclease HI family protein [Candidatus Levybacteria bacterium]